MAHRLLAAFPSSSVARRAIPPSYRAATSLRHRPKALPPPSLRPLGPFRLPSSTPPVPSFRSLSTWNWSKLASAAASPPSPSDPDPTVSSGDLGDGVVDPAVQTEVLRACSDLHAGVLPLNEKIRGPLEKSASQSTALPFVLLVGNHSSGKSTFINHVLGRTVQTSGVAPTDDCFTIIAPGPQDIDQDGHAALGDPDMGFGSLRQFGPALIHHTQLKIRSDVKTRSFMMVDSPGMIDSPASHEGMMLRRSKDDRALMDRGYDFEGVVRWYSERADVILLFFDPDKPGTTGETLSILVHALGGMDHKLLIVLNKADQFRRIHDFARAYGSLCWNLSKVIPRKDLPRIYTMCLPVSDGPDETPSDDPSPEEDGDLPLGQGLADLRMARREVVAEVMKAPKRRIDNAITRLGDSVNLLRMHAVLTEDLRSRYVREVWSSRLYFSTVLVSGSAASAGSFYLGQDLKVTAAVASASLAVAALTGWYNSQLLRRAEADLASPDGLSASFRRSYARQIAEGDEFTASLWERVRGSLELNLSAVGLANVPAVKAGEVEDLDRILEEEIPRLRRLASPSHFGVLDDKR